MVYYILLYNIYIHIVDFTYIYRYHIVQILNMIYYILYHILYIYI